MKTFRLAGARARPTDAGNHWYAVESELKFGAGARGTPDCCSHSLSGKHARQIPTGRRSFGRARASWRRCSVQVAFSRVAGLDVHRDSVMACVRVPGKGARREVV